MDKVRRGGSDKQEASVLRPDEQELGCVEMECSESELVEERGSEQGGSQEGVGDKERSEGRGRILFFSHNFYYLFLGAHAIFFFFGFQKFSNKNLKKSKNCPQGPGGGRGQFFFFTQIFIIFF